MSKISKASKFICALLITIACLHLATHLLLLCFSEYEKGVNQVTVNFSFFSSTLNHQVNNSWQAIAQALEAEGFNSLAILSSAQLIPYFLVYFFLFKLFKLYQQGKIFTLANSNCLRNIGKTLMACIGINIIYPLVVTLFIRLTGLSDSLAFYVNIGSEEFIYLLAGLIIYVMAWVMTEANTLHHEQELVI